MCHPREAREREERGKLAIFEVDPEHPLDENEKRRLKLDWAITHYKWPAADVRVDDPDYLRPLPVLKKTIDYILSEIIDADLRENTKFYQKVTF